MTLPRSASSLSSACSSSFTAAATIITAIGPQLFLAPCEVRSSGTSPVCQLSTVIS
jgi:hypothetical protein